MPVTDNMKEKSTQAPAFNWAKIIVDELARLNILEVVIAPGSRSTPLTLAFAQDGRFRMHSLLDERGAAFFALGLGLANASPAILVCTSGTAAANFFPAIIEASQSHVPMIVLTADRPHELRETGANQTIDQIRLYGSYVRYFRDLLPPVSAPSSNIQRYLRTTMDRAAAAAQGTIPGPVHLNLPFRKPLEPILEDHKPNPSVEEPLVKPAARIEATSPQLSIPDLMWPENGLIIAGPDCPGGAFPEELASLSNKTGYPIIADGLSGLRFGPWTRHSTILNPISLDAFAKGLLDMPGIVLQFGVVPTSNSALNFLKRLSPDINRIAVHSHGTWHDDAHTITQLVHADPAEFCEKLGEMIPAPFINKNWSQVLKDYDAMYWKAVHAESAQTHFEGLILAEIVAALPADSHLFVSNSLPVRHLDEFVMNQDKQLKIFCNRGASGIDGTLATGLGIGAASNERVCIVLGDLSFYHDLNSLLAIKRAGVDATIIVINNNGGGIFRRLPVAPHEPAFTEYFLTPHGLDFSHAAALFETKYKVVNDQIGFLEIFKASLLLDEPQILEVFTKSELNEQSRAKIASLLVNSLEQYKLNLDEII